MKQVFSLMLVLAAFANASAAVEPVASKIEFVNVLDGSFDQSGSCDQVFIAWTSELLSESSLTRYILVHFESETPGDCISPDQARSGLLVKALLRRDVRCDSDGDPFGTWGDADSDCIKEKGWASDCWEERSYLLPLGSRALSLKEIDGMHFECYGLVANPFLQGRQESPN